MPLRFSDNMRDAAGEVFQSTEVLAAYAFGSCVNGGAGPNSDLDIGYFLACGRTRRHLALRDEMLVAARLSSLLNCDVDLRGLDEAPIEVQGRAMEQGVCLYCADETARGELENAILAKYRDAKESIRNAHQRHIHDFSTRGL